ncbi:MAG: tRNA-specific adenosine deaminase [Bacteroidetes bacterium GWF2_43_63]|nr:MAG: tRNA-specific adenosine deaminase [Bacteroidetes bacterium GWE2_42_42]OFY53422.1 MAG: tRNA-specific adenosine deaminase [Bacteroidetes bacterium GWF2_43_63]HBG69405.1 tRNA-specific adenosine deaminase [Bacteroidales bacterium]HCB62024.1 tRNA-specific adenosine deaminase [Bacteroidales bacterium]HCY23140.1 tRNA-specific adenosine deaminase [Bacteroidales bacterium]
MENKNDRYFLQMAVDLAAENVRSGRGGPFGAVIVKDGEVLATGVNLVTSSNDPTAHAEVTAIRNATSKLKDFQLKDCILYSSCEPCPMCLGAIYWARPERLVFATSKHDAASVGFDDAFIYEELELSIEARHLKTEYCPEEAFKLPFQLWKESEGKTEY